MTRITITRNRSGRVRIGFSAEDFSEIKTRFSTWAQDEAACLECTHKLKAADVMDRLSHALGNFEPKATT